MDIAKIQALKVLQNFDLANLARTEELGKNFNFEEVKPHAEDIIEYANTLAIEIVSTFPQNNQNEIYNASDKAIQDFNRILSFDNSQDNSIRIRSTLITAIEKNKNSYFNIMMKYRSMMPVEIDESPKYQELLNSIDQAETLASGLQKKCIEWYKNFSEETLQLAAASEEHRNQTDDIEKKVAATHETISEVKANIGKTFEDYSDGLKNDFENLKSELKESLSLEEARSLWESKRKSHRLNYFAIGIVLTTILIITPAVAIYNIDIIAAEIKKLSDLVSNQTIPTGQEDSAWVFAFSNQITRLLIIGLPITAYIWATRILVRIFLANRALMDDAYERKTMLDTYLYLVGEGKAKTEDRPLVLNALFRPSPGHAPDIEPPNLSDIIKLKNKSSA